MANPVVTTTSAAVSAGHSLEAVEAALVALFCEMHNLQPVTGGIIDTLLTTATSSKDAREALSSIEALTLDDLVMAFETLVPPDEAAKFGAVFTPEKVTEFMATQSAKRLQAQGVDLCSVNVVDPAVGCGALLIAALRALVAATSERPHLVAERLYGCDVSQDSVSRARVLIALTSLYLGDTVEPKLESNVVVADALLADWAAVFGRRHFEMVLGNPPYVRYQQLPEDQRTALSAKWASCDKGNFNLYFPFFEVAHTLADPHSSVIGLITPNAFLSSLSGGNLRAWMCENRYLDDVVDFGHHRVFDALTYTAVSFAQRSPTRQRESFGYTLVAGLPGLESLQPNWAKDDAATVSWSAVSSAPWRLVGKSAADSISKIHKAGPRLADVADVRFGVATCRDKLYLLDGSKDSDGNYVKVFNKVTYRIEPEITRPCARVSSLADQHALDTNATKILYPYTVTDGKATVLPERTLAQKHPGAYAYFSAIRSELARRDKGKKVYAAWYAYARTQGLVPSGDKLLTPLYAATPRFLRDTSRESLFINGCAVTVKSDAPSHVTLDWLSVLLNSGVCRFYVESTAKAIDGGFFAYQKTQLNGFTVPKVSTETVSQIRAMPASEQDDAIAELCGIVLPAHFHRP